MADQCDVRRTRPVNGEVRYEQCIRTPHFGDGDHAWAAWTPDPEEMAKINPKQDPALCKECLHPKVIHGTGCAGVAGGFDCNCIRVYCPGCGSPPEADHADDCPQIPPWAKLKCLRCGHPAGVHASAGCLGQALGQCDCTRRASQGYAPDVAAWNEPSVRCDVRRAWGNGRVTQCTLGSPHHGRDHDFPAPEAEKCPACTIEGVRVARKDCPMHRPDASKLQVGGNHYKDLKIQPWDIWEAYGLDAFTGAVIKYLLRDKGNRLEDLKKARHTLDKLIELEERKAD